MACRGCLCAYAHVAARCFACSTRWQGLGVRIRSAAMAFHVPFGLRCMHICTLLRVGLPVQRCDAAHYYHRFHHHITGVNISPCLAGGCLRGCVRAGAQRQRGHARHGGGAAARFPGPDRGDVQHAGHQRCALSFASLGWCSLPLRCRCVAGPGSGDFEYAGHQRCACSVILVCRRAEPGWLSTVPLCIVQLVKDDSVCMWLCALRPQMLPVMPILAADEFSHHSRCMSCHHVYACLPVPPPPSCPARPQATRARSRRRCRASCAACCRSSSSSCAAARPARCAPPCRTPLNHTS